MSKIIIDGMDTKEIIDHEKINVFKKLRMNNIDIGGDCDGRHTCGKCKVEVISPNSVPGQDQERKFLTKDEIQKGIRLACYLETDEEIVVKIKSDKKAEGDILTDGYLPEFEVQPALHKKVYTLPKASLDQPLSLEERWDQVSGVASLSLEDLRKITDTEPVNTAVYHNDLLLGIEEGDTSKELYGVVIDIGTTTVAVSLIDVNSGHEIASKSAINPQKTHGQDVLTRISYVQEYGNQAIKRMKMEIVKVLEELCLQLCEENRINSQSIYEIHVAANTVMTHLFLGVNPISIGKSPYVAYFRKGRYEKASEVGFKKLSSSCRVYIFPAISAFVGGDIVAGIHVADLYHVKGNKILLDIGTNGEMVLSKNGQIFATSCAAGPALEGMNISCGMRAQAGAIEEASYENGKWTIQTIGNELAIGVCGSGILAVIREFINMGLITQRGNIAKVGDVSEDVSSFIKEVDGKRYILISDEVEPIYLTQKDIRQIQFAKGAILSGLQCMVKEAELDFSEIDEIFIAGQFGSHLAPESLIGAGMLPEELEGKITYIGNASKNGAYLSLMSKTIHESLHDETTDIQYIELSNVPGFDRIFAKASIFPKKRGS